MTDAILRLIGAIRKSVKSQKDWTIYEKQEADKRRAVMFARKLIEHSYTEYEGAKRKYRNDLKKYTTLTLSWSPERVLSKHKDFGKLCKIFKSDEMWRKLSRKERRFIANAVQWKNKN